MICTFYSFKGGVGRSMALANIAELLYRRGLNVLMVDFDLEAPGLERFFDVPDAINKPIEIQEKRGIIDLLISYKELCSLPPQVNFTPSFSVEPIANFITPIYEASDGKGTLSIIQAGCCRSEKHLPEYAKKIRFFDWNEFYSNLDGGHFFNWFREELEKTADIILVDSRTGFAEISGICAYQLADLVILFVAANEQNFDGTKMMAHSLRNNKLIQEARQGRALDLLFVPSRVERAESDRLDKFKEDFENCFREFFDSKLKFEQGIFLDLAIPYIPKYAYTEQVATRDFNNPSKQASSLDLNEAYNNLTITIAQLAPKDTKLYKLFSKIIEELSSRSHLFSNSGNFFLDKYVACSSFDLENISNSKNHTNIIPNPILSLPTIVQAYQQASKTGLDTHVLENLKSASIWMGEAFNHQSWDEVELVYDYINQAIDKLLQLQSSHRDKEVWLKEIQGLAVQAAYALAKNNKLQDAVMTLEQGLARLLLAKSKKHYSFEDIKTIAKEVPLVYIMMTELGGLALIVHYTTITPVWLDKLIKITSMINYLDDYFKWQQELQEPIKSIQKNKFIKKLEETTSWLWHSIMKPLMTKISKHSKVMLIAVGELNQLPFHAAWTEDQNAITGKRYALDTLTIAYVPNARTLIEAKKIAKRVSSDNLLAVGAPETHIRNPLPNAKHEVETIVSFFKKPQIITGKAATHYAVLNSLKNHDLLHFACHGSFEKGLVMANDKFISLENLSNLQHFNARLVVLSSCETGITNINLPDEAISLSSGFLQAGAAAVIASFWDVADDTKSMMIMIRFYDLWRNSGLEPVEALRQAQLWMRDSTNGEKLAYFKQCVDNATLKKIRNTIGFFKMENRDFAHPFHWASFNYVGV